MKKIIFYVITLIFLNSTAVFSDLFYCSEDDATGFDLKNNYEQKLYKQQSFQVKIDWQNGTMSSEKIWLKGNIKCVYDTIEASLYCMSDYGSMLVVNKNTLKFHYSSMYLKGSAGRDDFIASHGKCEKF